MKKNSPTLIVILDGWTKSTFEQLLNSGDLPDMQRYVIDRGLVLDNVVTNLPSVSIASHLSLLSSCYINEHHIPGHRWLDKTNKKIRSYFTLDAPKKIDDDINSDIQLVFDQYRDFPSISVEGIVRRGATKSFYSPFMSGGHLLKKAAKTIKDHPNSMVVTWLPKVDSLSHTYGPNSQRVLREMKNTSIAVGKLAQYLAKHDLFNDLKIVMVPDHGQREVRSSVKLEKLMAKIGLASVVNPKTFDGKLQTILTSGDASAQIYLTPSEFDNREEIGTKLCSFDEIEIVCWKVKSTWYFVSKQGKSCAIESDSNDKLVTYQVLAESDPLNIVGSQLKTELDLSVPMIAQGYYPDFLHQIMHSHVDGRSGDLLVFPSPQFHFGRAPRMGFRFGYHRGSHGGPLKEEVLVTGICAGFHLDNRPIRLADLLLALGVVKK